MAEENTNTSASAIANSPIEADMYPAARRYVFYGEWCSDPTVLENLEEQPKQDVILRAEKVYRNGYCLGEPVFYLPGDVWTPLGAVEWEKIPLEKEDKFLGDARSDLRVALFQMNAHRTLHHAMAAFVYADARVASKRTDKRVRCISPAVMAKWAPTLALDIPKDQDLSELSDEEILDALKKWRTLHETFLKDHEFKEADKNYYMFAGGEGEPITISEVYKDPITEDTTAAAGLTRLNLKANTGAFWEAVRKQWGSSRGQVTLTESVTPVIQIVGNRPEEVREAIVQRTNAFVRAFHLTSGLRFGERVISENETLTPEEYAMWMETIVQWFNKHVVSDEVVRGDVSPFQGGVVSSATSGAGAPPPPPPPPPPFDAGKYEIPELPTSVKATSPNLADDILAARLALRLRQVKIRTMRRYMDELAANPDPAAAAHLALLKTRLQEFEALDVEDAEVEVALDCIQWLLRGGDDPFDALVAHVRKLAANKIVGAPELLRKLEPPAPPPHPPGLPPPLPPLPPSRRSSATPTKFRYVLPYPHLRAGSSTGTLQRVKVATTDDLVQALRDLGFNVFPS